MSAVQPDLQNKTSLDNYLYYKIIRKKLKYQKGTLILFEFLFLFNTFIFYWLGYNRLFMPAFYLLIIKDIYLIVSYSRKKPLISLSADIAVMMILAAQTIFFEHDAGILEVLMANIFFYPAILLNVRNIKNAYIEEKLSSLKDYPYFSLDLYKSGEEEEYNEFDDDTGDKLLKTALLDVQTENASQKIRIIKFCVCTAAAIAFALFVNSQSIILKLKDAQTYLPDSRYIKEEYVNVDVIPDTITTASVGDGKKFWIRINDTEKYIYIRCGETEYANLSGDKPVNIKGKIKFAEEGELKNQTLSKQIFNDFYSEINDEQKTFLDSISNRELYIKLTDEDLMRNRSFYCFIFILIFIVAYGLLIILPRKNKIS